MPLDELKRTRQETEDVEENKTKSLIIVDMELVAVKHHRAWVDKADENSQSLETYDAMRQTTGSEREAKDQITEQANKYARNGGRRYREPSEISKIVSVESKVENEKLSVKMRLTKVIYWNQAKFGVDAEKHVSDDAKKTLVEVTQLLESVLEQSSKSGMIGLTYEALKTKPQMRKKVHQIKVRREVLEKLQEFNKEKRKDDNDELRNFAARFNSLQLEQDTRSLETAQLEFQDAVDAKDAETAKRGKPEVRKLNSMTREELCYSGAGRPSSGSGCWHRISGSGRWCRPRDVSEQRKWLLAPHQRKWPLVQTKNMAQAVKVAAGAASVEVAVDAYPANNQGPEADGGPNDNVSLAPTDPEAPPMSVGQWAQQNEPTEAERFAQVCATKAACVDAGAACVDVAGLRA